MPFPVEEVGGERPERSSLLLGCYFVAGAYQITVRHACVIIFLINEVAVNSKGGWVLHSLVMECRLLLETKETQWGGPRSQMLLVL